MNYEDLDPDTKGVITAMCDQTGKTKEKAILALIEFGMVSMIAAVSEPSDKQRLMNNIYVKNEFVKKIQVS